MAWMTALPIIGDLARKWLGGRQEARRQDAEYDLHARQAYSAEYQARGDRYWFDAFVDGVNRLVRPAFTFGVVGLFGWAVHDAAAFAMFASALAAVPDGLWTVLAIIVGFWFGGRLVGKDLRSGFGRTNSTATAPSIWTPAPGFGGDERDAEEREEDEQRAILWPNTSR